MAKSKEELIYDIENNLVDSNTGKITGERVKARLLDMVDAMGQGGGGSSQMTYWRINDLPSDMAFVVYMSSLSAFDMTGQVVIVPSTYLFLYNGNPIAIAIDMNLRILLNGEIGTVADVLALEFGDLSQNAAFTQITEEEFYTI